MKIDLKGKKEFGSIELLAKQLVEGFITGLHKSPYHGFSVEFAEHRLYNSGESTRHVDWKVFAKTERLYTKQYEEETNLRCRLIVDSSRSMYYPKEDNGKIRFSVLAAAAIAYLLQKQRDAIGLCTFAKEIETYTTVKSTATHLHKLYMLLEQLINSDTPPPHQPTNVAKMLHEIAEKTHKRSLVILFSDMFDSDEHNDEIFKALQHLKHNKHEVLLFHVSDRQTERDFSFEDRPYEFIDLESNEKIRLQPHEVKAYYREKASNYFSDLKLKCGQLKIDFVEADINEDYNHILSAYLIKRSKMK